jgi:hypothetical protein
MVVFYRANVHF